MALKPTVFGSLNEKELYFSINSIWQENFTVYPQLPFCAVFDIGNLSLTDKEVDFLRKTSVDYTLCKKDGKPLISIEFDGLGHGFSKDGKYIQILPSKDPYRKLKLDLKLKIARIEQFPFFVVSYDEKVPITDKIHLTIVDGIIGQTLKHLALPEIAKEWIEDEKYSLDNLSESEKYERIQDIVVSAEVIAELKWDPIAIRCSELEVDLLRKGTYKGHQYEFVSDPELPDIDWPSLNGFEKRVKAFKDVIRWGCKYTVHTSYGDFTETAWVRNFENSGVSPMTIAENIAGLLAHDRAIKSSP